MFESARIRLTAWYLLIIMSVSILFSVIIYNGINSELSRFEQREQMIQEWQDQGFRPPRGPRVDLELITAARMRLITTLGVINLAIFVAAGGAGYFLAGRTLRPIQNMVDQLNRFISDASHELRTPLTSLRSEMEVSLLNKKLTTTDARKIIESNLEEVIHLQLLSDKLLELTQYEKTNGTVTFTTVAIADVIAEAVKNVHGQAKKKQIVIKKDIKNANVFGNADRLRELFTILLDNAIKYSNPQSTVAIAAVQKGKSVIITFADDGIGIDEKELPNIFDRFYRADRSRSKHINGFGLGLSIAKKIATLHKGTIAVTSAVDKGTTFTIKLPLQK